MSTKINVRTIGEVQKGELTVFSHIDNNSVYIKGCGTVIENGEIISTDTYYDVIEKNVNYTNTSLAINEDGVLTIDLDLGICFTLNHNDNIRDIQILNAPNDPEIYRKISITRTKDNSDTPRTISWGPGFLFSNGEVEQLTQSPNAIDEIFLERIDGFHWVVFVKRNFSNV